MPRCLKQRLPPGTPAGTRLWAYFPRERSWYRGTLVRDLPVRVQRLLLRGGRQDNACHGLSNADAGLAGGRAEPGAV